MLPSTILNVLKLSHHLSEVTEWLVEHHRL